MIRKLLPNVERSSMKTKLEEVRQAKRISGGVAGLCVAAVGVRISRIPIPSKRLRTKVYRTVYGKKYAALDEAELERPIHSYPSLNSLFTRAVKKELRPIADSPSQLVCPCDGLVQETGPLQHDSFVTAKGIRYTLDSLLPGTDTTAFHRGHFGVFFLSPRDCHRVFCPQGAALEEIIHVPGYRLLVHPPFQRPEYPVYTLNERVVLRFSSPHGAFILVLVAGWGVGNITFPFDAGLRPTSRRITHRLLEPPRTFERGEWVATFELGSTVILILAESCRVEALVDMNETVNYGQPAFSIATQRRSDGNGRHA